MFPPDSTPSPSMTTTLRPPFFSTVSLIIYCKKVKEQKLRRRRQIDRKERNKPTYSFPRSSPTPLLLNAKPCTQTKFQALDAIVTDLEASIKRGIHMDAEIFSSILESCYQLQAIDHGIRVHRLIPPHFLRRNVGISYKILRLYASFGYLEEAHNIFDEMSKRDKSAFPWNSLISGYAELGLYEDAVALYFQMEEECIEPDQFTFPRVLKACGGIGSIQIGKAVHRHIIRSGFSNDIFVLNALIDMYSKCGDIVKAQKAFNMIANKDLVSWNSMLTSYIHHELLVEAMDIFNQMIHRRYEPDSITLSTILTSISSLHVGVQIHGYAIRREIEWNLSIANSLIIMYSNNGMLDRAKWVFNQMPEKDVVSWNSIISAHSKKIEALSYFGQMKSKGVLPDNVTFVSLLSTCAHLGLVSSGVELYSSMKEKYRIKPIMEHYACLVNVYGRAGLIKEAYGVIIEEMEFEAGPTVWGALLHACLVHGKVEIGEIAAEKLFDLEPDNELNFDLLMRIYKNSGRFEDEKRVKMMMVDRGLDLINS